MIVQAKPTTAIQWFKLGDYKNVKSYESEINTRKGQWVAKYHKCKHKLEEHGYITMHDASHNFIICPGDWLILDSDDIITNVLHDKEFHEQYIIISEE